MTKHTTGLSGKDFREPLIRVLGTQMGFKLDEIIPLENTYDPILTIMGITREDHGECLPGIPWVERWIQFAYKDLCETGLAKKVGRGKWTLTQEGLDTLCQTPGVVMSSTTDTSSTLSLMIDPGTPGENYHADAYLRSLAIERSSCFGHYTEASPVCSKPCTIQGYCINGLAASLSLMAKTLAEEDAEELRKAEEAARKAKIAEEAARAPKPVAPVPVAVSAPQAPSPGTSPNFRNITLSATGKCRKCDEDIISKTRAVWSRHSQTGTGSAIYHEECFKALYPAEFARLEADEKAKRR